MKILFAGDIHGYTNVAKTMVTIAKETNCDAVFQLGDFGYWEHTPEGVEFIRDLVKFTDEVGMPVYFLDGNHDKVSLLLETYKRVDDQGFIILGDHLKYAPRGLRWIWAGVRFISLGGAYSVDKQERLKREWKKSHQVFQKNKYRKASDRKSIDFSGYEWFPEEEMTDEDLIRILAEDDSPVDIILAHDKPRASNPAINLKDFPECWLNQDRMQRAVTTLQPKLYMHGHLHYRYEDHIRCGDGDKWTKVIGLNCNGERGTWVTMDLADWPNCL